MGYEFINKLPTPAEIKEQFPLPVECIAAKAHRDEEVKKAISGQSDKFLVIIGPCSADNEDSVLDYTSRLVKLQEDTKDKLILIPRIYTNKPRTTGDGYKGMLHQPDPEKRPSMADGLHAIRHLHMRVLMETGLSTADEMLYPDNVSYLDDIMSYIAVGARSVENQQHRLVSSGCHVPVGMKNPTSGDLSVMLNSVHAAQHGKEQIRIVKEVLHSRRHSADLNSFIKGVMIESYIEEGNQKIGEHCYGKSITDPCLGWEDSERLIYEIAEGV